MYILPSKKDRRMAHWREIKSRITTHEGEFVSGSKGESYQQKYGEKYLGIKWKPTDFSKAEYQKELKKR